MIFFQVLNSKRYSLNEYTVCQIKIKYCIFFFTEGISEQQFQIIELTNFFLDCIFEIQYESKGKGLPFEMQYRSKGKGLLFMKNCI